MPVTANAVVSYTLMRLTIDMEQMTGTAVLRKMVDGEVVGPQTPGPLRMASIALLMATPDATKTRGNDVTDAVYQFAVDRGFISGTIG